MKQEYPDGSREKLLKVEALRQSGATEGERAAAEAAVSRIKAKLPIQITATVLDIDKIETFYEVTYKDLAGKTRLTRVPKELFQRVGSVVDLLIKAYADLPDDRLAAIEIVQQALDLKSPRKYTVTSRCGWHGESLVYPTRTFGPLANELRYDDFNCIDPAFGRLAGNICDWCEGLREPAKYSDFVIFVIAVIAASPLLALVGEDEGAVFHLHGTNRGPGEGHRKTKSSSGKSLVARIGASLIGSCRKNDLVSFAASSRGVEDFCHTHNHLGAVFDEEGRALASGSGPRIKARDMAYVVASGRGTFLSKKANRDPDLQNLTWLLFVLSTGEEPLDDARRAERRAEGAQVRMSPVPVPPGHRAGIFNRLQGTRRKKLKKAKRLARQLEKVIASNYGVAAPAFIEKLVAEKANLDVRIRKIVDKFVARVGADTDPWERRFATKYGLVLAGAILLSEFDIGPWSKKRARIAVTTIYRLARAACASNEEATTKLVRKLQGLVTAGKRFPLVKKGQKLPHKQRRRAWGVREKVANVGTVLLVPRSRLHRLTHQSPSTIIASLAAAEVIHRGRDGKLTQQKQVKALGSKRCRYVCFSERALMKFAGRTAR
jgi:Domain of unknown function (DUF927)